MLVESRSSQKIGMDSIVSTKMTQDWGRTIHLEFVRVHERSKGDSDLKIVHKGQKQVKRQPQEFCTGSRYRGRWDSISFAGFGMYVFPHGPIYKGYFKDGQFHGDGDIYYPMGHHIQGKWKKGKLISYRFYFADGLEYSEPWRYCEMPDRRFRIEVIRDFQPAGEEYITNAQPVPEIPEDCYDTGDGYFDPKTQIVYFYAQNKGEIISKATIDKQRRRTTMEVLLLPTVLDEEDFSGKEDPPKPKLKRLPTLEEIKFIESRYRVNAVDAIGYRPDLYEFWISGRKNEVKKKVDTFPEPQANVDNDYFLRNMSMESVLEEEGSIYSFEFF